jgi:hypothetical protein
VHRNVLCGCSNVIVLCGEQMIIVSSACNSVASVGVGQRRVLSAACDALGDRRQQLQAVDLL